jgi:hypothetical protein
LLPHTLLASQQCHPPFWVINRGEWIDATELESFAPLGTLEFDRLWTHR